MINIGSIVIRVEDLEKQKAFWTAALDYVPREGDDDTFALLRPRDGSGPEHLTRSLATPRSRYRRRSTLTSTPMTRQRR